MRDIVPDSDGFCQPVPGHPSEHGAHAESTWSRPLQENHYDSHMTDSRLFGDHPAGAARAVDTVRNFRRIEPAADCGPPIDHSSTRDSPLCPLSVMPEAISDSERGCDVRNAGWLKTSRVNHGDGVLTPHTLEMQPGKAVGIVGKSTGIRRGAMWYLFRFRRELLTRFVIPPGSAPGPLTEGTFVSGCAGYGRARLRRAARCSGCCWHTGSGWLRRGR